VKVVGCSCLVKLRNSASDFLLSLPFSTGIWNFHLKCGLVRVSFLCLASLELLGRIYPKESLYFRSFCPGGCQPAVKWKLTFLDPWDQTGRECLRGQRSFRHFQQQRFGSGRVRGRVKVVIGKKPLRVCGGVSLVLIVFG